MRRRPFMIWIVLIMLLLIYAGILLISIQSNNIRIEEKAYKDWAKSYVMKNDYGSFVNTSDDKKNPISLSEGQGYGMLITVLAAQEGFADETDFKPLVTYYENFILDKDNYLMNWKQEEVDGKWQTFDPNSATDGDLDIAYALLVAGDLWPDSKEDYRGKGLKLLDSIKKHEYNETTKVLAVGNWATSSKNYWNLFRPSDVVPNYYEKFYEESQDDFWQEISKESLSLLEKLSDQNEFGLIPDFAWIEEDGIVPAEKNEVSTKNDGDYSYNALRIPFRLANSTNETAQKINKKLLTFFSNQEIVQAGYTLEGEPIDTYQSISYSSPLLMATKDQDEFSGLFSGSRWVMNELIEGKNYYGDSLKVIAALHLEK